MDEEAPLPALRFDVEPMPFEHEGKPMFALHDPEGLSSRPVALSPGGMFLASLLDGKRSLSGVRSTFAKATGQLVQTTEISKLVEALEKAEMLETAAVQEKRKKILSDFIASPVRKAQLGYPAQPLELSKFLGEFFRDGKGPGKPLPDRPSKSAPPKGLVAPHIDILRGGSVYAWCYRELADAPPPDLVIALGVAHESPRSPWTMTKKAFETANGPLEVDKEAYQAIASELWYDPLDDEGVHRKEHSLEVQALWLKFLWRDNTPPWVPILCSTFERFSPDRAPSSVETVEKAIERIGARLSKLAEKRRVLVLAGVDLAHVGPHFGDELELGPELAAKVEAEDLKSMGHALKLEADPFYLSVVADGHWRKVCGLSALYTAVRWMKALGAAPGELLSYGQAPDPRGGLVSFAGAVYR
jgi:AmmeMemoRadiSam system protein B